MTQSVLYFLSGPTAVGKTAVALEWAAREGAEILSCDAVQFYRGMDIGSAKPSAGERQGIPHHGIDCAEVDQMFTVGNFQRLAQEVIPRLMDNGKKVLVTGGSGFYLSSFFQSFAHLPPVPAQLRAEVRRCEEEKGLAGLQAWLHELDPAAAGEVDLANPRRVARAIERCVLTGQTLAQQKTEQAAAPLYWDRFERRICLLDRMREDLNARIAQRVRAMREAGLEEEVRRLRERGLERNPSAARAIGYRETLRWLDGEEESPEAWDEAIQAGTRRLARKQRIWFRRFFPEAWAQRIILPADREACAEELQFVSADKEFPCGG